jgi:hypothetical protein
MVRQELADSSSNPDAAQDERVDPTAGTSEAMTAAGYECSDESWNESDGLDDRDPASSVDVHVESEVGVARMSLRVVDVL